MVDSRIRAARKDAATEDEEPKPQPRYFVDMEGALSANRALGFLVADRRCHACQRDDDKPPEASSDPAPYIKRIVEHCKETDDYLPPDTPLKESLFRVLLTNGDEPMTPSAISQVLSDKWTLTPYPRDVSPEVLVRLLDHSETYCIAKEPGPEAEEASEEAAGEEGAEDSSSPPGDPEAGEDATESQEEPES